MPGEDPASFADIADFAPGEKYHELAAGDLQRMIRRTVFAAARDEGKYAMRGVLWDMDDKKSASWWPPTASGWPSPAGRASPRARAEKKGHSHLVPPKAMSLLERILADGDASQPVQVSLRNNDALFKTERAVIYSRLVEGRFPPYRDVIPKKANAKIPLVVNQFLSAVRQAAIMTDDESKRITFQFAPGKLMLEAQGATTGRVEGVDEAGGVLGAGHRHQLRPGVPDGDAAGDGRQRDAAARPGGRPEVGSVPERGGLPVPGGAAGVSFLVRRTHGPKRPRALVGGVEPPVRRPRVGPAAGSAALERAWAEAAGAEYVRVTRVSGFRRNVLEVEVKGAVPMQELSQFHKKKVLERLRKALAGVTIADLRFPGGGVVSTPTARSRRRRLYSRRPPGSGLGPLRVLSPLPGPSRKPRPTTLRPGVKSP